MQICVAAGEVSGDQILAPILSRVSESVSAIYSGVAGPQMIEAEPIHCFHGSIISRDGGLARLIHIRIK